ncbi:hypothetical protein MMC13_002887 [Lambiella insularis]|nr:hypothetical protein [Lambiella insularis]
MISSLRLICFFLGLLAFLYPCIVSARPSSIWTVDIDESPAPAPQDGPPLSASAIRDKAYLPLELGALFGAYLFAILVIATALFTVGRRLRRSAQTSPRSLAMEMMKPVNLAPKKHEVTNISPSQANPWGPSPVTPLDAKNMWPSPDPQAYCPSPDVGRSPKQAYSRAGTWDQPHNHNRQPSIQSSIGTFDESVIEQNKAKNEIEMARLYAAAIEHQEKKQSRNVTNAKPLSQNPPELQHLRLYMPPNSPPKSLRLANTISPASNETSPTSPQRQARAFRPSPISITSTSPNSRASSRSSFVSFGRKNSVRKMGISAPISPPMGSPEIREDHMREFGDAEPLTPREYNPGPPPIPPPKDDSRVPERQQPMTSPRIMSFSKHFSTSIRSSRTSAANSPAQSPRTAGLPTLTMTHDSVESLPQQIVDQPPPRSLVPKSQRKPAPLPLRTNLATDSAKAPVLRTAPLPLRNLGTGYGRPLSTIKATVVESKPDLLHAPRTGVPSTPYSPFYFPSTPLTPMTPSRLVTKEERKRRKKEEGRRVATFEDAVIQEKDMWGDAY